ncbi:MAG: C40 family peptidase [Deltaproteobacteria bacterium]|nr:C40 family peptidase [Deltaproteobacteria bacterium]
MHIRRTFNRTVFLFFSFFVYSTTACADKTGNPYRLEVMDAASAHASAGYTIQVGAYSSKANAYRVIDRLQSHGIDAYCFSWENGLFKVRFGRFPTRDAAAERANRVYAEGAISDFLIVKTTFIETPGILELEPALREEIVETTRRFIGLPYRWGQMSATEGFDCSGLTMTVYRLNGLRLPRSSVGQWRTGTPVKQRHIKKGDLVFFLISGKNRVSHVGIYVGGGYFIHAPGKGKHIRTDSLSNNYFRTKYAGARTFF